MRREKSERPPSLSSAQLSVTHFDGSSHSCLPFPFLRSTSPHPPLTHHPGGTTSPRQPTKPATRAKRPPHYITWARTACACAVLAPCPGAFGGGCLSGRLSRADGAACGHPSPSPLTRHTLHPAPRPVPLPLAPRPPHPSPLTPTLLTRHLPCDDGPTLRGSTLLRPPACQEAAAVVTALPCPLPHV